MALRRLGNITGTQKVTVEAVNIVICTLLPLVNYVSLTISLLTPVQVGSPPPLLLEVLFIGTLRAVLSNLSNPAALWRPGPCCSRASLFAFVFALLLLPPRCRPWCSGVEAAPLYKPGWPCGAAGT